MQKRERDNLLPLFTLGAQSWAARRMNSRAGMSSRLKPAQAGSSSLLEQASSGSLTIHRQATSRLDWLLPLPAQSARCGGVAVHEWGRESTNLRGGHSCRGRKMKSARGVWQVML